MPKWTKATNNTKDDSVVDFIPSHHRLTCSKFGMALNRFPVFEGMLAEVLAHPLNAAKNMEGQNCKEEVQMACRKQRRKNNRSQGLQAFPQTDTHTHTHQTNLQVKEKQFLEVIQDYISTYLPIAITIIFRVYNALLKIIRPFNFMVL